MGTLAEVGISDNSELRFPGKLVVRVGMNESLEYLM
jgi:hypothetical protein